MKIVAKLVWADVCLHPTRLAMTSLAVIAAACTVIWVVSGYDALLSHFDEFADEYMGRYDLIVVARDDDQSAVAFPRTSFAAADDVAIPATFITALGADSQLEALDPVMQTRVKVSRPESDTSNRDVTKFNKGPTAGSPSGAGRGGPGRTRAERPPLPDAKKADGNPPRRMMFRHPQPVLVGTDAASPPYAMVEGRWIDSASPDRMEAAISSRAAEGLEVGVGDELIVETAAGEFRLTILGIVEQASMRGGGMRMLPGVVRGPAAEALYVPTRLAETITDRPASISYLGIVLNSDADVAEFRDRWLKRIEEEKIPATVYAPADVGDEMKEGRSAAAVKKQAYAATGISLLAALFIILTTLSMGVNERVRQFAILRAVSLTRMQIAAMITAEGLLLAVIGWAGGLAAGWGLLQLISHIQPDLFADNAVGLGFWAVVLSGICAFGGALAASIIPAWRAARISPLDAMAPVQAVPAARLSLPAVIAALALLSVNPLLVFFVPMADDARYGIYAAAGCTSMALGFVLLAAPTIIVAERIFAPLLARLLRLDSRLLHSQLSGNLWRTLGTTVALSLGLGLFAATQIWGYTMLGPFVPGDWTPDLLVSFQRGGMPDEEIAAVRGIKGVNARQCLPLAVEQPRLAEDITGSRQRISIARQDNVIMIGLDPEVALDETNPLLDLNFVAGSRAEASSLMKKGRYCIVPKHFAEASGLGVGDGFKLMPPEIREPQSHQKPQANQEPVEYKIAGIVTLPGWHWMTKFSGLRRRSGRSAAMVFAGYDDIRRDFNIQKINFFWMNLESGAEVAEVGNELQKIADRNLGKKQPVNAQGTWSYAAEMFGSSARLTTPEFIKNRISNRAAGMIWGMCRLPLVTLAVAAIGVINAVLASIRARRWEMGVMRSMGLTRFGLFRLILAEAVLIGLAACLLSLGFGLMAGWCGAGISRYVSFFGGMDTPLVVPWANLAIGFAAALALCLAAALWPAANAGHTEPLKLLQAGRGAM